MRRLFLIIGVLCLFGSALGSEKVIDLIEKGDLDKARAEIDRSASAVTRDGTLLYGQALLETDGVQSARFLDAAFKAGMDPEWLEDNICRKVQYYLADEDYENVVSASLGYLQYWENGKYRPLMLRLHALSSARIHKSTTALKDIERLTRENPDELYGVIGELERARVHYKDKEYISAQNICRRLTKCDHDEVVAPALYLLSYYAFEQKRIDDAILYYNILKEGYPTAVGLDDLVEKFSGLKVRGTNTDTAEKMTGTYYCVQVGVYSQRDNARRAEKYMKKYDQPIDIKTKKISDKKYYVVYVGDFTSSEEAMAFKARLESLENEAYQVVAR